MSIDAHTLYTIGYATKPIAVFIAQLKKYRIDVLTDVRSVPYSNAFADYHRENIAAHLRNHNIRYVYLGEELGPRSKDDSHYDARGQVQFARLMTAPLFLSGIERLRKGLHRGFTIALMCAEKDASTCHRSLLIGYYLRRQRGEQGIAVRHIDHQGSQESQAALEERIMARYDKGEDLFLSREERMQLAYRQQLAKTAYRREI